MCLRIDYTDRHTGIDVRRVVQCTVKFIPSVKRNPLKTRRSAQSGDHLVKRGFTVLTKTIP